MTDAHRPAPRAPRALARAPRYRPSTASPALAAFILGASAALVATALAYRRRQRQFARVRDWPDSAPARTRRALPRGETLTGNALTVNRDRAELFAFWRDFANLPTFMENVRRVVPCDGNTSVWTIAAPGGTEIALPTEVVEERAGELIAWRTLPDSDVEARGEVRFRDAPAGRGTVVEATVAYVPPGGEVGRLIAKLFQREPAIQGRRELRRFKMLMETGEIATSANRKDDS
jgi:uncharacterized membrane protein